MKKSLWWRRLQIQVIVEWRLMPGDLTFREWLFSPVASLIFPGWEVRYKNQVLDMYKDAQQVPEGKDLPWGAPVKHISRIFWARVALRILGFDIGAGVYFLADPR